MGIILIAKCSCGYSEKLFVDRGMVSKSILAPALCRICRNIQSKEFSTKKTICNNCNSEMVFYNEISLQKNQNAKKIINWGDSPLVFEVKRTKYYCPKCEKYNLRFKKIGFWD